MKTLLLIDGHAMIHRAFHALPLLTSKGGMPTNAIYGFFGMLQKAIEDFQPTHMVVCFDTPAPSFRKELFDGYQAKRPPMQDDLRPQFDPIKKLLDLAGVARLEKEGFEADDVIGTLTRKYQSQVDRIFILTGDRDILQLVDNNVYVITPQTGISLVKVYDIKAVEEKFGLSPQQIPDYKALAGDASDNYHIGKGIGPKTATQLLQQYTNLENLLSHLAEIRKPKLKEILEAHKKTLSLFKQLATIRIDVPVDLELNKTQFSGFRESMQEGLKEFQLYSLMTRLFKKQSLPPKQTEETKPDNTPQLNLF